MGSDWGTTAHFPDGSIPPHYLFRLWQPHHLRPLYPLVWAWLLALRFACEGGVGIALTRASRGTRHGSTRAGVQHRALSHMDIRDSHTHIVIVVVDSHVPDASPDTALLYVRVACPVRVLGSLLVNEVPATRAPRRSPSFSLGPAQVLTSGSVRRASVRYPHR